MKEYILILKTILLNNYRNSRNKYLEDNDGVKKLNKTTIKIINIIMVVLGVLALLGIFSLLVHIMSMLCAIEGLSVELLSLLFTGSQLMIVFFGLQAVLSNTFYAKDTEFLAQLPISAQKIFAVKMTIIYINELLVTSLMLLPLMIAFCSGSIIGGFHIPFYFYLLIPFVLLTAPIIPLVLVSALSFPLIKVVTYFKKRNIMTLVISVVGFAVFIILYMLLVPNLQKFVTIEGQVSIITPQLHKTIIAMGKGVFFNYSLASAIVGKKFFVNMLIYFAVLVVGITVVILMSAKLYTKSASQSGEAVGSSKGNKVIVASASRKKMLFMREFRTLFRDQNFAFNSILGFIMTPLLVALMSFMGTTDIENAIGASKISVFTAQLGNAGFILFYSLMMMCGMNYGATLSFSRDGNTFYNFKYMPVSLKEIIGAKVQLSNAMSLVGLALLAIVCIAIVKMQAYVLIPMLVAVGLYSYAFNNLGVYRDLKKPNVNWTSAYEVIKKNIYPMIPMFFAMAIGMVFILAAQLICALKISPVLISLIYWSGVYICAIIIIVLIKIKMKRNAQTFFDRIDCSNG
ncbi:MAG: hypothetical protein RR033_01705 [Clostridia bacterium]